MERYFFSAKQKGFFLASLKEQYEASTNGWPDDVIEISEDYYKELLAGLSAGKVLSTGGNGKPILTAPVIDWQAKAESQRQSLLTAANATMTVWEREESAGILDDDDKASLTEWIKYAKALRKLDLSSVSHEAGYNAISWPDKP